FRTPVELFSFADYERAFGGFYRSVHFDAEMLAPPFGKGLFGGVAQGVSQFFANGGTHAYVIGLRASPATAPAASTSIFNAGDFAGASEVVSPLDKLPIFNLLAVPDVTDTTVLKAATACCERNRAFLIVDPPPAAVAGGTAPPGVGSIEDSIGTTIPPSPN